MIPIVGEKYWWTVENSTYPKLTSTKYCNKIVEVTDIIHEHYLTVRIVESTYKGEIGLTFSTVPGCLYDIAVKVLEVL